LALAPGIDLTLSGSGPILVVAAASAEASAIAKAFGKPAPEDDWRQVFLDGRWSLVRSGVGKVNAALCVARGIKGLEDPRALVLNLGICGALPAEGQRLSLGSVVVGTASVYADEGVLTPRGFVDMASQGFPYWNGAADGRSVGSEGGGGTDCSSVWADAGLVERVQSRLAGCVGASVRAGRIATVSTCSGTDSLAREIAGRTKALAEAMEGAAIGHALMRLSVPTPRPPRFLEIRVVSNTTGDRSKQVWEIKGALAMLTRVVEALRDGRE
jgi:futalosine hydrolase